MSNPNTLVCVTAIKKTSKEFAKCGKGFNASKFVKLATAGIDSMPLKSKVTHVRDALLQTMPASFADALSIIEANLSPPMPVGEMGEVSWNQPPAKGLQGWMVWAVGDYVAEAGKQEPERALRCLHALTQRFTSEFSIRPFMIAHPDLTYKTLKAWIKDPSPHVRRLVSEGSRPRLPWGVHLKAAIKDPSPSWPIIEALQDDPSIYVRRSVANHLNDIAKDHPDAVAAWVRKHRKGASPNREWLLKHASRTLIKDGHVPTLEAWDIAHGYKGTAKLTLSEKAVQIGDSLRFNVDVTSTANADQKLVIDYAVHHVRSNGKHTPKVFKGWARTLLPKEHISLSRSHPFKLTTRKLYPGLHRIDVRINGTIVAEKDFQLSGKAVASVKRQRAAASSSEESDDDDDSPPPPRRGSKKASK